MSKIEVVSMVRINGQWMNQNEVDPKLFNRLLGEKLDYVMGNQGFIRKDKTA